MTLEAEDDVAASFVAPGTGTPEPLTFEITVTDNGGLTATDTVSVTVTEEDGFCFIGAAAH